MKRFFYYLTIFVVCVSLFSACKEEIPDSEPEPESGPLRIVHWADPQLGWLYQATYEQEIVRLKRAVELINELSPDVVLLAGDMVHHPDNDDLINAFLKIIAPIKAPIIMAPGNHDICHPITTETLKRYRSFFGDDFQTMELKDFTVISANSSLWYPEGAAPEEILLHDDRLKAALQNAQRKEQPIVMMTHISPLFDIPKSYQYLAVEYGAFLWLSGHWHCSYRYDYEDITILIAESTSANDTGFPLGVRLLTIYPDKSFDWDLVPLYPGTTHKHP